jgi:hypothetical protein
VGADDGTTVVLCRGTATAVLPMWYCHSGTALCGSTTVVLPLCGTTTVVLLLSGTTTVVQSGIPHCGTAVVVPQWYCGRMVLQLAPFTGVLVLLYYH